MFIAQYVADNRVNNPDHTFPLTEQQFSVAYKRVQKRFEYHKHPLYDYSVILKVMSSVYGSWVFHAAEIYEI